MSADPARCPLCGGDNACAMQADGGATHCWCETARFNEALLARVPEAARRRACICAPCVNECATEGAAADSESAAQAR